MALLNLQNISLHFGNKIILDDIDIQIHEGEKISLLGRNGAGKSTIMKLIAGEISQDSGNIIRDKGLKTALLTQNVPDNLIGSIYEVIAEGIAPLSEIANNMSKQEEDHCRRQIEKTLSILNLNGDDRFENLSAGMKRRVLLGRVLVNDPHILLLDEPTNHLDIESIRWLEEFLVRYPKTVFFVTHDRAFMQKIANRIVELDRGKLFDWRCAYQTFLERKDAWLDAEEKQNALFDKRLSQEEAWLRKGVKARRTRNEGRVRALKKMRNERSQRREIQGTVKLEVQKSENSGKIVIEANDISFGYNDKSIIKNFSTTIMRGDKIAIIGPNGCGKSTLIKLLLNELQPTVNNVKIGTKIETAYFDQLRNQLDDSKSVRENVTDGTDLIDLNGKKKHVVGYLQDFLFTPDVVDVKVKDLSGGEKNRLLLARLFAKPFNFLIMDEPTNDLDIETIELLEELLLDFEGTLLLVSHDREFVNNVASTVLAFEGDGLIKEYAGGYEDWLRKQSEKKSKESGPVKNYKEERVQVKKKLSFKEKALLELLPKTIEEKENEKALIISQISDPEFYKNNGPKISVYNEEIARIEKELENLYIQWDELETLAKSFNEQ